MHYIRTVLLVILGGIGSGVYAQPVTHIYVGVAGLQGEFEREGSSEDFNFFGGTETFSVAPTDSEDKGWAITYGYQFRKHFAVEAQLFDGGEYKQVGTHSVDSAILGVFSRYVVDDNGEPTSETEEFAASVSYQGTAETTVKQRGFSVMGVGIWPVTQQFSLRAKLGFALISSESRVKYVDQFPEVLIEDVLFVDANGVLYEDDLLYEGGKINESVSGTESEIPLLYGVEASFRFGRDWSVEAFWLRQQNVGGGFIGRSADLDLTGAQVTYHY